MQNLYMYLCDTCGHSQSFSGLCPKCETPLSIYTKETQEEYDGHQHAGRGWRLHSASQWSL